MLLGVIGIKVSQETQVATVDSNNFNIVAGERARRAQHITVAANDNREISLLPNLRERASFHILQLQFVSDLLLNDDLVTFCAQPAVEHFMCCQCSGVPWVSTMPIHLK